MRTWSRRGQTPILQYNFNWDTLSAVAGITFYNFYFRLYKGSVKSAEVVEFLAALLRHIAGPLLIVWDRLSAHRSRLTRDFIAGQGSRLWVEYLPGYAPELNPVEYIWAYCSTPCPTCARRITGDWTRQPAGRSSGCVADRDSSPRSGSRLSCLSNVSILCERQ